MLLKQMLTHKSDLVKYSFLSPRLLNKHSACSYQKLRLRDTMDFPLLGVAVFLHLEERDERCKDIRLVLGAIGPSPFIVEEAAQLMCGKEMTPKLIEEVSQIAWEAAHPVANTASSPSYRRDMVRVLTKKAMDEALNSIKHAMY